MWVFQMHTFYLHCVTKPETKYSVKSDKQPRLICAGLSFPFSLLSYRSGSSSADAVTLMVPQAEISLISLLILFQPSAPLSPAVNTETLNAAQTVREKPQHAFHISHNPTIQPVSAHTRIECIKGVYW